MRAPASAAWSLVATVDALGTTDESTVATLSAVEVTPLAWAATGVGVLVVVVSMLVAIDKPPPGAERVLLLAALAMAAVTVAVVVARPAPTDFTVEPGTRDLVEGTSLPTGVSVDLAVEPSSGPVLLGLGALVVAGGTVLAMRRG